tara:strand:+ start:902 stop:1828 length:927 start_codon:yes stop_codon:yes gene_type:complete
VARAYFLGLAVLDVRDQFGPIWGVVMKKNLTRFETAVIKNKATEPPHSGLYCSHKGRGQYHCKACGAELFSSEHKFDSGCGWPSFDGQISTNVKRIPDADGRRTEILCNNCDAHLGHVFEGEGLTDANVRHCVNSVSIEFQAADKDNLAQAIFASGCFWGTQYYLARVSGVLESHVGYIGGETANPTYEQVCRGNTGHLEALQVFYDSDAVSYKELVRVFFETHDFSQENGQGPDIGSQYLSAIFVNDDKEKVVAEEVMVELRSQGYKVATMVKPVSPFYLAEEYHQNYYEAKGDLPYCHRYREIFKR